MAAQGSGDIFCSCQFVAIYRYGDDVALRDADNGADDVVADHLYNSIVIAHCSLHRSVFFQKLLCKVGSGHTSLHDCCLCVACPKRLMAIA